MVDADWQIIRIREPEVVKENLGLGAGVVKDQRCVVLFDLFQNGGNGVFCAAPCPRWLFCRQQHRDVRIGTGIGIDDRARVRMAGQLVCNGLRVFYRCR